MLAFYPYRWNQLEVIPLACTARTKSVLSNAHSHVIYILKNFNSRTGSRTVNKFKHYLTAEEDYNDDIHRICLL